jgi:class 3 adenylate cyclase
MALRNSGIATNRRIEFRVGINLGDVVVEGDDLLGDGVNVAAHLESIAEPGGICVSEDAYRHLRGKVDATFTDRGERQLKNIAEPVRVYGVAPLAQAAQTPRSALNNGTSACGNPRASACSRARSARFRFTPQR